MHTVLSPDTPVSVAAQALRPHSLPPHRSQRIGNLAPETPAQACRVSCEGEGDKLPSRKRDLKYFRHDPWSGADLSPLLCLLPKRKKSCRVRRAFKELLNQRYMGASHLCGLLPELQSSFPMAFGAKCCCLGKHAPSSPHPALRYGVRNEK